MAWVLAVLGVAGLGYSIWSAIEGWAALRWPVVEGEITSSKVKQIPGVRRFGYGGPSYEPSVAYSYRVLGTTYSGTRLRFGGEPTDYYQDNTYAKLAQYPVGTTVRVHYQPDDPSRSVLEPGVGLRIYLNMAFFSALLLFGVGGIIGIVQLSIATGR